MSQITEGVAQVQSLILHVPEDNSTRPETEQYCISKPNRNQCEQFQSRTAHKITAMRDCLDKESVTKRKSSSDKYAAAPVLLAVRY